MYASEVGDVREASLTLLESFLQVNPIVMETLLFTKAAVLHLWEHLQQSACPFSGNSVNEVIITG